MFEVEVESRFRASHQLRGGGPHATELEPLHAHDWPVTAVVAGDSTDETGCLVDFHRLAAVLADVLAELDGTNLNEHPWLGRAGPSAEHVARYLAERLAERLPAGAALRRVTVGEAAGCRASFLPG